LLLEQAYKYVKFMKGKDLDAAQESVKWERFEAYIAAARNAALIF
jgi:hypothetical protein